MPPRRSSRTARPVSNPGYVSFADVDLSDASSPPASQPDHTYYPKYPKKKKKKTDVVSSPAAAAHTSAATNAGYPTAHSAPNTNPDPSSGLAPPGDGGDGTAIDPDSEAGMEAGGDTGSDVGGDAGGGRGGDKGSSSPLTLSASEYAVEDTSVEDPEERFFDQDGDISPSDVSMRSRASLASDLDVERDDFDVDLWRNSLLEPAELDDESTAYPAADPWILGQPGGQQAYDDIVKFGQAIRTAAEVGEDVPQMREAWLNAVERYLDLAEFGSLVQGTVNGQDHITEKDHDSDSD